MSAKRHIAGGSAAMRLQDINPFATPPKKTLPRDSTALTAPLPAERRAKTQDTPRKNTSHSVPTSNVLSTASSGTEKKRRQRSSQDNLKKKKRRKRDTVPRRKKKKKKRRGDSNSHHLERHAADKKKKRSTSAEPRGTTTLGGEAGNFTLLKGTSQSNPNGKKIKDFFSLTTNPAFRKDVAASRRNTIVVPRKIDRKWVSEAAASSGTGKSRPLASLLSAKEPEPIGDLEFFKSYMGTDQCDKIFFRNTFWAGEDKEVRVLPISFIRKPSVYNALAARGGLVSDCQKNLEQLGLMIAVDGNIPAGDFDSIIRYAWAHPKECITADRIIELSLFFKNNENKRVFLDSRMVAHFLTRKLIGTKKLEPLTGSTAETPSLTPFEKKKRKRKRETVPRKRSILVRRTEKEGKLPGQETLLKKPIDTRFSGKKVSPEVLATCKRSIMGTQLDVYSILCTDARTPHRNKMCSVILSCLQKGGTPIRYTYKAFQDSRALETFAEFRSAPTKQKGGRKALPKLKSIEEETNDEAAAAVIRSDQLAVIQHSDSVTRFPLGSSHIGKLLATAPFTCGHFARSVKTKSDLPVPSENWLWPEHAKYGLEALQTRFGKALTGTEDAKDAARPPKKKKKKNKKNQSISAC